MTDEGARVSGMVSSLRKGGRLDEALALARCEHDRHPEDGRLTRALSWVLCDLVRRDGGDPERLAAHLRELRAGHAVQVPVYDYTIHNRSDETVLVKPAPVIIVEGILIFDAPELCELMDMKVFVDTDADVRILRRIVRDVKERGRTLDSVVTQYLTTVKPMHEQFVEPSKRKADLIVPEGGRNLVALELLIKWIADHLRAAE